MKYAPKEAHNLAVLERITAMPWVYLFPSLGCNLSCPYCIVSEALVPQETQGPGGMSPKEASSFYQSIGASHFIVSGGEPFFYGNIAPLVSGIMSRGHMVSFVSNLTLPLETLRAHLAAWPCDQLGFFNITHHYLQVSLRNMLPRLLLLKKAGARFWVKYIALPDKLTQIADYMAQLRDLEIGVIVAPLVGHWQGKYYPGAYREAEIDRIVELLTINAEGLNLFDGISSLGIPCRGGNDVIGLRMYHERPFIPCCNGEIHPKDLKDTFFGGQPKQTRPCREPQCRGLSSLSFGFNQVHPEIERLARLSSGHSLPVGREAFWAYLRDITDRGFQVVNQSLLMRCQNHWGLDLLVQRRTWLNTRRLPLNKAQKCNHQAEASYSRGCLWVASMPQQWAYICQFDLAPLSPLDGPCQVEVKLEVARGILGVGLLHSSQDFFLREVQVSPSPHRQAVTLDLPDGSQARALVLRTCARDGQQTRANIRKVEVRNSGG